MSIIASIWIWISSIVLIVLWFPLLAVIRLFDSDPAKYRTGRWFRRLGKLMTHLNPMWSIEVTGKFPENPRLPYVVVGNHQSLADIPVVSLLPWEMKWVAKIELFRLPFVGGMLKLAGDIPVDRTSRRSGAEVMIAAKQYLEKHCSVMFFPEGTRSRDGVVRTFSDGPFSLAIKCGVPVIPLAIDGTANALPKHRWRFTNPGQMRLKVLDPVSTAGLSKRDAADLRMRVQSMIEEQLLTWRSSRAVIAGNSIVSTAAGTADAPADSAPDIARRTAS